MKYLQKPPKRKNQVRSGVARLLIGLVTHPALASYTPAGPGSLATGQSGAVRVNRRGVSGDAGRPSRGTRSYPSVGDCARINPFYPDRTCETSR